MKGSCFNVWVWKPDAEISSTLEVHAGGTGSPAGVHMELLDYNEKNANVTLRAQVTYAGRAWTGIMETSSTRGEEAGKEP